MSWVTLTQRHLETDYCGRKQAHNKIKFFVPSEMETGMVWEESLVKEVEQKHREHILMIYGSVDR